jgi:hypothetical protein
MGTSQRVSAMSSGTGAGVAGVEDGVEVQRQQDHHQDEQESAGGFFHAFKKDGAGSLPHLAFLS